MASGAQPRQEVDIPVTVVGGTEQKPVPAAPARPAARPTIAARPQPRPKRAPSGARTPITDLPHHHRQRLMWWIVGAGTALAVIGWIATWNINRSGSEGLFGKIVATVRQFRFPGQATPPAEQEIRNLDKQVFPQFSE